MAVNTPEHLKAVGLLDDYNPEDATDAADLNYLMQQALDKITFLPFGLLMDKYRWSVFAGETGPEKYQEKWDELRLQYQGLIPPVERSSDDFDAAGKFHISNNVPYIRYFVSFIVQFQFYEKMCITAGKYDKQDPTSVWFLKISKLYENCELLATCTCIRFLSFELNFLKNQTKVSSINVIFIRVKKLAKLWKRFLHLETAESGKTF